MTDYDTTGFRENDPHGGAVERGKSVTGHQLNSYKFDVIAVTTVNVHAETEDQARAMIDGLNSITTSTTGDEIEAVDGLDVSTSDYDVVNVSPRGRGYLVSAEAPDGEEISVSVQEQFPEPIIADDRAGLREELAEADRALEGDSNDAEHDDLYGLTGTLRGLLDGNSRSRTGQASPAISTPDATAARPAPPTAAPARPPMSGTVTPPAAPLAVESFPRDLRQGLRPDNTTGASSGQSAHSATHRQPGQSSQAAKGRGRP